MKLQFICPGDKITLLKDAKIKKSADWRCDWKSIPKGTILEVSQVYIRKRGWFDSSLTFKIVGGPGFDKWAEDLKYRDIVSQKNRLKNFEAELKDLVDHDADFSYTSKGKTTYVKGEKQYFSRKEGIYSWLKSDIEQDINSIKESIENLKKREPSTKGTVIRVFLEDICTWEVSLDKKEE